MGKIKIEGRLIESIMMKKELEIAQKHALELGILVDSICRKYNITYSIIGDTLWGADKYQGFAPWDYTMKFLMSYEDYNRFLTACEQELDNETYYIVNETNRKDFKEIKSVLAKRSAVKLPPERKNDELYYDYTVSVMPYFNSTSNIKEYKKHVKSHLKYKNILKSRMPVKGYFNLSYLKERPKRTYLASKDKEQTFIKLKQNCFKYKEEGKFILLPAEDVFYKGVVCLLETYKEVEEVEFEGHKFLAIKKREEWLGDYFGAEYINNKPRRQINRSNLKGPEILRRIQLIELEMLIEVDRICRAHNIKYTLSAGTLLGAVRHKGFIPWDDDIDVTMLKEDYDRFIQIASQELDKDKYFLRTQETDKDCNLAFAQIKRNGTLYYREARNEFDTHLGIFIDIFPLYNGTNNLLLYSLQTNLCLFFKSMLWSHMGARTERRFGYKTYYNLLSRVPNKTSYKIYLKLATMFKNNNSKRVAQLNFTRNPFRAAIAMRENYHDLIEMEFEGHMFYVPRKYKEYLQYAYSTDYLLIPEGTEREAKHLPAIIELNNLYTFDRNDN